jgi:hypothetical protein
MAVRATMGMRLLAAVASCATLATACAHAGWRDELGRPVELNRVENIDAADDFFEALTARRRDVGGAEPSVAPQYQSEMRQMAEDLQAGKSSLSGALVAVGKWARAAYGREVETYALDCSPGAVMSLPPDLIKPPFVAIAFAAAYFRPPSLSSKRCVILTVAVTGSEVVKPLDL